MKHKKVEIAPKSEDVHESLHGTNHGYIVEWRCVDGVRISAPIDQEFPCQEWRQAPYDIKKMQLDGAAKSIVYPVISHWDDFGAHSLAAHGLVSLLVADAIVACLKTLVEAHPQWTALAGYIEFRARPCRLVFDWKITKNDMDDNTTAPAPDKAKSLEATKP